MNYKYWVIGFLVIVIAAFLLLNFGRTVWHPVYLKLTGHRTVADVELQYGLATTSRLKASFDAASLAFPPKKLALIAYKDVNELQLWGSEKQRWALVKTYQVKAASGVLGPKLTEGDKQVPEGIYSIESLNPNSAFHLSMKLNYPNEFDLTWAKKERRHTPGTNIFIHGKAVSIGCLAMGDESIEELFLLVNRVGRSQVTVIISPTNPYQSTLLNPEPERLWVNQLYEDIRQAIGSITQQVGVH